jgi:glycine cleavage system H protein
MTVKAVIADPSMVNADPMGSAWLIKVRFTELPELLSAAEYEELTAG